ncbi:MAG: hypothetical protein PHQ53_02365 [Candidatus Krumholzibacteria bacterium]|nr:hypothetical protein [Candidatus Krumholzibacteria bacterium]
MLRRLITATVLLAILLLAASLPADVPVPVPPHERGNHLYERMGQQDANNIRTRFWSYGMVGDYPPDPINVDLSVFHSVEVPKGSGLNYSDGITPFVLAKIVQAGGDTAFIMETGYRERQGTSPFSNRDMRFEPRPGYFQEAEALNPGRSPAVSNDPRTWPDLWPDRLDDLTDPGWAGAWNGYFGKQRVADQESYTVMDDQYYDAWDFNPDSRDPTRRGLGLRIEVRGFQWANPQARYVIFWHYDITNEGTTDYDDNIIFGIYMDSGVGGSAISCDGIAESDDDNAFYQDEFEGQRINLVYTWDRYGHGVSLTSNCARTGYLGYAYMETPGNPYDGNDNDLDGITDERRDSGPGIMIEGQDNIRAYVTANYDIARFEAFYGPLEEMPAYIAEVWWTGDEDMDWVAEIHDVGADGKPDTGDAGEGDGIPTAGEPNFDRTDVNESDQIGLTGFKLNRIRAGQGNPNQDVDGIVFFTNTQEWPRRLYEQFTAPNEADRFDQPLASNYNIAFLFASGPFKLPAGQTERFSLALAYGADLQELARNTQTVQKIYNANYRFAVPPEMPTVTAEAGDGYVRLSWDDVAEHSLDPVTGERDFEGYRIYRATDPDFVDCRDVDDLATIVSLTNGQWITAFDLINGRSGFSEHVVDGRAEYLGSETGIQHTWTDHSVTNGQQYYYAVTAYDHGSGPDKFNFPPSENAIAASRTPRGGLVLPSNVVAVRPNPRVIGYVPAHAGAAAQVAGRGDGRVLVEVVNSGLVPDGDDFAVSFTTEHADTLAATVYTLTNIRTQEVLFETGTDFAGAGTGPVGAGLLPIVTSPAVVAIDSVGWRAATGSRINTDARIAAEYLYGTGCLPHNMRRPGYPDDISVVFYDDVVDTSLAGIPAKFQVIAHSPDGDLPLDFQFRDLDGNNTLSGLNERIDVVTYPVNELTVPYFTWRFKLKPGSKPPAQPPAAGDVIDLRLTRPLSDDDRFVFRTSGEYVDAAAAGEKLAPYVVPNPYVASAGFEPERFAVSGRGERRLEFRGLPANCAIRIYNIRGELVQTLRHDGSHDGFVAWDLRTKNNLDVAPGLYIFHVDGGSLGKHIGKFAIIK